MNSKKVQKTNKNTAKGVGILYILKNSKESQGGR